MYEKHLCRLTFKRCPANNSSLAGLVGHVDLYVSKEVINMTYECTHKEKVYPPTLLHPC